MYKDFKAHLVSEIENTKKAGSLNIYRHILNKQSLCHLLTFLLWSRIS